MGIQSVAGYKNLHVDIDAVSKHNQGLKVSGQTFSTPLSSFIPKPLTYEIPSNNRYSR